MVTRRLPRQQTESQMQKFIPANPNANAFDARDVARENADFGESIDRGLDAIRAGLVRAQTAGMARRWELAMAAAVGIAAFALLSHYGIV